MSGPYTQPLVYFFGLAGAGFSWAFYHLFAYAYSVPRITRACLEQAPWAWYWQVLRVMSLGAVTYGVAWLVLVFTSSLTLFPLAIAFVVASAVYALAGYLLIGSELKGTLQRLPSGWLGSAS